MVPAIFADFIREAKCFLGKPLNEFLFLSHGSVLGYMATAGGRGSWESQLLFSVSKSKSNKRQGKSCGVSQLVVLLSDSIWTFS